MRSNTGHTNTSHIFSYHFFYPMSLADKALRENILNDDDDDDDDGKNTKAEKENEEVTSHNTLAFTK